MTENNVSSLAVFDSQRNLIGIFTDKDCRQRVIVEHVDSKQAIHTVMTPNPLTIEQDALILESVILMMRHRIKHLPVTSNGIPVSMITLCDVNRLQHSDPILITHEIQRADNVKQLVEICKSIPDLLLHLIKVDVRADDLGRILTSITGALTRHLITLAQKQYGAEPVPFVWLSFGSQGRQDQSAKSDQDNGLLLANDVKPEHDEYFENIAKFVNHGLDACGYVYCPGDIMAQNKKWRLALKDWLQTFSDWIIEPETKALMHTSIFFDMRPIYISPGAEGLFDKFQQPILEQARGNSIFLALLTQSALDLRPPLGFFQQLVVDHNDEHKDTFDIKLKGIMPINDIARIHALANGISEVHTRARIQQLIRIGAIAEIDGNNLLDAHEFIAHRRLIHQGQQMSVGKEPDNHLSPKSFSLLTVRQLKDAFKVVSEAQAGIKRRYSA